MPETPAIRAVALASGSNGNSVYVETADARLLLDAGLSGKRLAERAATRGVDLDRLDALVLSHNHSDHVAGAGVVHRRHGPLLYATRGTWSVAVRRLGKVAEPHLFPAGETLRFGSTSLFTVPTPHDGVEGVAFVIEARGRRLGVLTDLGHPFPGLLDLLGTLDAAFLEANYDPDLLSSGPYPAELKARISGPSGHLSNQEAVTLAAEASTGRLRSVFLSHLSGENNSEARAARAAAPLAARGVEVRVAGRRAASAQIAL